MHHESEELPFATSDDTPLIMTRDDVRSTISHYSRIRLLSRHSSDDMPHDHYEIPNICRNCTHDVSSASETPDIGADEHSTTKTMRCDECGAENGKSITLADITGATRMFGTSIDSATRTEGSFLVRTSGSRTAIGYDSRMELHVEELLKDPSNVHPERPDRTRAIWQHLQAAGIVEKCIRLESTLAQLDELRGCHTEAHVCMVEALTGSDLDESNSDMYTSSASSLAARISAGICTQAVRAVAGGEALTAICVIRPPGHHAEPRAAGGFCFYNNVAVAARVAQKEFGMKKVMIVDWDVHHGNGTQAIFEEDDSVLFISLHRFDDGFYPGTGAVTAVGTGAGRGFSVNIPWQRGGMGDADYLAAFNHIVLPIGYEFAPDLVFISAGFDAARGDPLGNCDVTPAGYAHMTNMLRGLAGGRLVVALEGGYNLRSISQSMEAVARVCLGESLPHVTSLTPSLTAMAVIRKVISVQSEFWTCCRWLNTPIVEDKYDVDAETSNGRSIVDSESRPPSRGLFGLLLSPRTNDMRSVFSRPLSTTLSATSRYHIPLRSDISDLTGDAGLGGALSHIDSVTSQASQTRVPSAEEAAIALQCLFRQKRARKYVVALLKTDFRRDIDESTGLVTYIRANDGLVVSAFPRRMLQTYPGRNLNTKILEGAREAWLHAPSDIRITSSTLNSFGNVFLQTASSSGSSHIGDKPPVSSIIGKGIGIPPLHRTNSDPRDLVSVCSTCFTKSSKVLQPCGHGYCMACWTNTATLHNNTCPVCNEHIVTTIDHDGRARAESEESKSSLASLAEDEVGDPSPKHLQQFLVAKPHPSYLTSRPAIFSPSTPLSIDLSLMDAEVDELLCESPSISSSTTASLRHTHSLATPTASASTLPGEAVTGRLSGEKRKRSASDEGLDDSFRPDKRIAPQSNEDLSFMRIITGDSAVAENDSL